MEAQTGAKSDGATPFVTMRSRLPIGGAWVDPAGGGWIEVINPATMETVGRVPEGTIEDVDQAVRAARSAFPHWAAMAPDDRAKRLDSLADHLESAMADLAGLISAEVGTPMPAAVALQAGLVPVLFRQYAEIARTYAWESRAGEGMIRIGPGGNLEPVVGGSVLVHEPIGVVGAITPWNYPLVLAAYKLAPALAAGCTVVLKPSEVAPLSCFALAELAEQAGLPAGVLNIVTGYGVPVGEALVRHPAVDMVTFTGSTAAGRRVAAAAADTVKRVHLELGGKSSCVVLRGADIAAAVSAAMQQLMTNAGQTCLAWSRLLVPADQQEEAARIAAHLVGSHYQCGDPQTGAAVGPLASREQQQRVRAAVEGGLRDGARLVVGGPEPPEGLDAGCFVQPTVFADVRPDMAIAQEEIFGPVLAIMPYHSEEDAVAMVNENPYGLHGAVFGPDTIAAGRFARRLRTGQVDVNGIYFNPMAPFGGYRQSGNGRELGIEGFSAYLETKAIQLVSP